MFDFTCSCGETLHSSEDLLGLHVRCPRCGSIVKIADPRKVLAKATPRGDIPFRPRTAPQDLHRRASARKAWAALALVVLLVVATAVLAFLQGRNPGQPAQSSVRQQQPEQRTSPPNKQEVQIVPYKQLPLKELVACKTTRPATGQEIRRSGFNQGLGELTVGNHTGLDAVIALVHATQSDKPRLVYVQSGEETTLRKIPVGSYVLKFALGLDWCPDMLSFLSRRSYSRFADLFDFSVRQLPEAKEYTTHRVTLHPVLGGTARTTPISEAEFLPALTSPPDIASEGAHAKK